MKLASPSTTTRQAGPGQLHEIDPVCCGHSWPRTTTGIADTTTAHATAQSAHLRLFIASSLGNSIFPARHTVQPDSESRAFRGHGC